MTQQPYGGFAYVYDRLMADMPYGEWLGWLEAYWGLRGRPETVLDLGCGTGTISIPLAASGLSVIGIDISEDMLAIARHKEASARSEIGVSGAIQWVRADMRSLTLEQPVDAVISLCDCMNYLTEEADVRRAIRCVWDALKSGGSFVFDMHHSNQLEEYAANEPFCHDEEDVSYIWFCDLDHAADTVTHRLSLFIRDGERYAKVVETHRQRAYPVSLIRRMLSETGFIDIETYADFSFESVDEESTLRIFFAARKPA
jgi:SAM-dependent methyltransferase